MNNYPVWRVTEWTPTDDGRCGGWKVEQVSDHYYTDLHGAMRTQGQWIRAHVDEVESGKCRVRVEITNVPHAMSRLGLEQPPRRPGEPGGASTQSRVWGGLGSSLRSAFPSAVKGGALDDHLSFDWRPQTSRPTR